MKFAFVDRIVELEHRQRIVTIKAVSLAEEYLADHIPSFPVLPGVLMLEAMAEAGAWLVRHATDFAPSMVLLRESRNVTYKSFVRPGRLLRVEVTCKRLAETQSDFFGSCSCEGEEMVKGRFGLRHYSLAQSDPSLEELDRRLAAASREGFVQLCDQGSTC